jgi:hypothetical protein
MDQPTCPFCGDASQVALLSRLEKGRHTVQTWACRTCVSSFGNVEEWRRQVRNARIFRTSLSIVAAVGMSALMLRRVRVALHGRRRAAFRSHPTALSA